MLAPECRRQEHIVEDVECRDEACELEYEVDVPVPELGEPVVTKRPDIRTSYFDGTAVRLRKTAHKREERGLAAAGMSYYAYKLALRHFEVDLIDYRKRLFTVMVCFGEVYYLYHSLTPLS